MSEPTSTAPHPERITLRPTSPGAESQMFVRHPVLDYGHVTLIDYMGNDESVVSSARVSYEGSPNQKKSDDATLIRYMYSHKHSTPFESCTIKLDMKLPIFVARQFVRHRTQALSEVSARYSELPAEYYIPAPEQVCHQSTTNKQGRAEPVDSLAARSWIDTAESTSGQAFRNYQAANEEGIARETARMVLPLNTYTHYQTTMSLRNALHFLGLRMDLHAQWEARQYANVMYDIIKAWVPITAQAFMDYDFNGVHLSAMEWEAIKDALDISTTGIIIGNARRHNLSQREMGELRKKLTPTE